MLAGVVLTPLHILEQLFFGFEKSFADVVAMLGPLQRRLDNPDKAVLIALAMGIIPLSAAIYFALGTPKEQRIAGGIFGALLLPEIHHVLSAFSLQGYYSGMVTGTLMFLTGVLLLKKAIF